jgi:hypothetical protein
MVMERMVGIRRGPVTAMMTRGQFSVRPSHRHGNIEMQHDLVAKIWMEEADGTRSRHNLTMKVWMEDTCDVRR